LSDKIWEPFLTEEDKAVLAASGFGQRNGLAARPALLIIDVSYGFCGDRPEPLLESIKHWSNSCGPRAWAAIPVIRTLVDAFHTKRLPVIYTTNGFRSDGWDLGSWQWKLARIPEMTSPRATNFDPNEIVREIAPAQQDIVIVKQKPSAFFGTPLLSYLQLLGVDTLIVTGTTTSGCVRAAVLDAFSLNFRCALVEEACFDRTEASHAINLFDMHAKYADVCSKSEILAYVAGLSDTLFPQLPPSRA
jgi:maleamate amidohydrolase